MKHWKTELSDGSESGTMIDLFGDPIVLKKKLGKEHKDKLVVSVTFKMTDAEFKNLTRMADKFGMSTSRYCRDAVRQALADHECILDPST
jgi:hypothetical protein